MVRGQRCVLKENIIVVLSKIHGWWLGALGVSVCTCARLDVQLETDGQTMVDLGLYQCTNFFTLYGAHKI